MTLLGLILFVLGFLLAFAGGIWTLVLSFMDSVGWGIACLFIPFAAWVFIFMKWSKKHVRQSFTVPADNPNYAVAQQKAEEYQKNLSYAINNAENK